MVTTHQLSHQELIALAEGRVGKEAIDRLRSVHHTKLLLTLRAILDATPADLGTGIGPAWDLLVAAEQHDPRSVATVFALPTVRAWAAYALRKVRGTVTDDVPVWHMVGQIHAIAAAAASRAQLDFHVRVPTWQGTVALPTLGVAQLPAEREYGVADVVRANGTTTVRAGDSSVAVPAAYQFDAPGWLGMRRIRIQHNGLTLSVWLDDLTPLRKFGPPCLPEKLSAESLAVWEHALDRTWEILTKHHRGIAEELSAGLTALVPREPVNRFRLSSTSSSDAFGCPVVALPENHRAVATVLIHELAHSKLNGLAELVELDKPDRAEIWYSPWRDDPRPLRGLLHGTYSFFAVTEFWRDNCLNSALADDSSFFEFALRRAQTWQAIETIRASGQLTETGRHFVEAMHGRAQAWREVQVPGRVQRLATRAAQDHKATWRLRHLHPDKNRVEALTHQWRAGLPCPADQGPASTLMAFPDTLAEPQARTHLTQWLLAAPAAVAQLTEENAGAEVPGATAADFNLVVLSRQGRARDLYLRQILADPMDFRAWIGLGLATGSRALLEFPELVRAVCLEISRTTMVDPADLLAWFERLPVSQLDSTGPPAGGKRTT